MFVDPAVPPGTAAGFAQTPTGVHAEQSGVVIDLPRRGVRLNGELLNLTDKEFAVLHYLMECRGRAVSRLEPLGRRTSSARGEPSWMT
ncbi:MAG: hypothetical protein QJR09_05820 [Micrococcus sp.]|nr:hypothetical protein [Micrococcus sp.]